MNLTTQKMFQVSSLFQVIMVTVGSARTSTLITTRPTKTIPQLEEVVQVRKF